MKTIVSALITLTILASAAAPASAETAQSSPSTNTIGEIKGLAQALRAGGHVILVRHDATFTNQADTDPSNFADVGKQRNLNDKGKELAKAFGEAIRSAGVPVGRVYTSQFNRAHQTAVLAGFRDIETTVDLSEGGLVVTPEENNRRATALRDMLAKAPKKGENDILITHKPNIVDALGKDWFEVKEGEASIFKPEGRKYRLLARVQMEDWPKIAAAVQ
jgi:phosphohistidine phosphatase SixA